MNRTLADLTVGTIVKVILNGDKRDFIVVQQGKPGTLYSATFTGTTTLLMDEIYNEHEWDSSKSNDYENSSMSKYLNGELLGLFGSVIKENVVSVKIPYRPSSGTSKVVSTVENGLQVKIWLLSAVETGCLTSEETFMPADGSKLDYFLSGSAAAALGKRMARRNGAVDGWYTRTPSCNSYYYAGYGISSNGKPSYSFGNEAMTQYGVRPAFSLPNSIYVNANNEVTDDCGISRVYVKQSGIWKPII